MTCALSRSSSVQRSFFCGDVIVTRKCRTLRGEPEQADTEIFSLSDVIVLYPGPAQLCVDGKLGREEATM